MSQITEIVEIHTIVDQMVTDIENGLINENYFNSETLFINIFFFFAFNKFLSAYCTWEERIMKILKKNIKRKWPKSLFNVDFFIKQMTDGRYEVDPFAYYYKSEDYFDKLLSLKPFADALFPKRKKKKNKNKKKIDYKYVLIR